MRRVQSARCGPTYHPEQSGEISLSKTIREMSRRYYWRSIASALPRYRGGFEPKYCHM